MILAILQARVSSTRLPGKVLMPILGKPMLQRQIERIQRARQINKLIVATSTESSDDPIRALCSKSRVDCFRGSLDDVLDRYYQAAVKWGGEQVVRLTGDCPLADSCLIDEIIKYHVDNNYDYTGNTIEPTFPDGLDTEIFRFDILKTAWQEARLPSEREHVTPFIWRQPDRFNIAVYKNNIDLSHMRWTVDEPEDFEFVRNIYEALYLKNPGFGTRQILNFLEKNPRLLKLNAGFRRNEGYEKSLKLDKEWTIR
jgi:spore coat polysaccharide biosynthesis protein SpsF